MFFRLFFSSALTTTLCVAAGFRWLHQSGASPSVKTSVSPAFSFETQAPETTAAIANSGNAPNAEIFGVETTNEAHPSPIGNDQTNAPALELEISPSTTPNDVADDFEAYATPQDTGKKKSRVRWTDSPADAANRPASRSLVLPQPKNYRVEYELENDGNYTIKEKYGDHEARNRSIISREELMRTQDRQSLKNFFREKGREEYRTNESYGGLTDALLPKIKVNSKAFETIFGSNKIDIKPNIVVMMTPSVRVNVNKNPQLTQRQQRNTSFNFDQNIQMDVTGSIGDKFKIRTNYDTKATFNFENQFKINFQGKEDDIIKTIEAGNVSLPLNGSLITGGQNLWGVKVGTQWGPVWVTAVASQQRGQTNEITVQGGAQQTPFEKRAHEYDENRHFFLCHYFRESYEQALRNLPNVQSRINVDRVEVWITNRNNQNTVNNRN
ncbi:MAG: cell surface protein SprA, partial [Bacteroidia bacterium]|nr:cell surface protein SprA [Bacteroidia bacterium]